jgi:hypothetical protein
MKKILFVLVVLCCQFGFSQNPNDCNNAILLCGDTDLGINPSGIGANEFAQQEILRLLALIFRPTKFGLK